MNKWTVMGHILLAHSALTSGVAYAQADSRPVAESDNAADDIIVTARRREERLQDVPIAVTVASGEALQRLAIVKPDELTRIAPGLVVNPGVYGGGNLNHSTFDQSIGVYFAEVAQARTQGLNSGFFDIASVQILKGPQGTLFGRNTTGGALIITPVAPSDELGGYFQGTYGSYDLADFEGAVNVPLGDRLQVRLAGKVTSRDGTIYSLTEKKRIGNINNHSWRASVRFLPTETLTNTLVVTGHNDRSDGTVMRLTAVRPGGSVATAREGLEQFAELQQAGFWSTTSPQHPDGTRIRTLTISNITELDVGGATLKNIFGYRRVRGRVDWMHTGDRHNTYQIDAIDNGDQISNELNISGTALDGKLDYIAGLFYLREDNHSEQITYNNYAQPLVGGTTTIANTIADPVNTSYSAYAQATYKDLFVPDLSLTAGIRYTRDKRAIEWNSIFLTPTERCRLVDSSGVALNPCSRTDSTSFNAATWSLSLDYKVAPDVLIYAATRRGYRAGGYTFTAYSPGEARPYDPEFVDDIEIGLKSSWNLGGDVRGRLNIAGYYQDYRDVQRNVTYTPGTPQNPGLTPIVFFVNAADATVKGIEIEADMNIGRALELSGSFSYSDAKYGSYDIDGVDYSKAPFAGAPKYTATWRARYTLIDEPQAGAVSVGMNGYYQSWTVSTDASTFNPVTQKVYEPDIIKARHIVDASIEWAKVMGTTIDIRLYAKNLFKEKYYGYIQNSYHAGTGSTAASLGDPRTFGLVVKYGF
jgi:iron complex outermembrane receptor protein